MGCEALVVGAGPVGLAMAVELARYGVSVRIVDKAPQRTDKSKALVVWSRTMELFDRIGCSAAFSAVGFQPKGTNIYSNGKLLAHLDFSGVDSPYPFPLMIPQSETERLLEEHLNSLGVEVERSVEMVAFEDKGERVTVELTSADGNKETVDASWLIGCDGAHSVVRHTLGLEFKGDTQPFDWILADLHLEGERLDRSMEMDWSDDGILALFPILDNRYRLIADTGRAKNGEKRADPTLEEVQSILDKRGAGLKASNPIWLACFTINERKVDDYRKGRVFVAGDAAHIHSPAGGQGMNTGIQDSVNLAWKLAMVLHSGADERLLLDSYSQERSHIGDLVVSATRMATKMAILEGDFVQNLRNHVASLLLGFPPAQHFMINALSETSIGYSESPLSVSVGGHEGPKAGKRAPLRTSETPVGAGNKPRIVCFAAESPEFHRLLEKFADLLDPSLRTPYGSGLWLVRPDGYVGLAAGQDDWQAAESYLNNVRASSV